MPKQAVSLILALLYLSVSLAASAHHHDDSSPNNLSQQCLACACHLEGQADVPTSPSLISVPLIVVIHSDGSAAIVRSSSPLARADRGPPVFS